MLSLLPLILLLAPAMPGAVSGQHTGHDHGAIAHDHGELGVVDFRASCDPAVQDDFDRAVGLLHHMMYQQSRQAFERIEEQHPECSMAHWGVAVALFQGE